MCSYVPMCLCGENEYLLMNNSTRLVPINREKHSRTKKGEVVLKRRKMFASIAIILLTGLISCGQDRKCGDDFLEFWTDVKNNYAYFDNNHTDWNKVKTVYLPQAEKAK